MLYRGGANQAMLFVEGGDGRQILEKGAMGLADLGHHEPGGINAQCIAIHRQGWNSVDVAEFEE